MPTRTRLTRRPAAATALPVAVAGLALAAAGRPARGGLLAAVAYDELVFVDTLPPSGTLAASTPLAGTGVPLHRSVTATYGAGTATGTYDLTDDGATASYQVSVRGQATYGPYELGGSTNGSGRGTHFTLSVPAAYTATCTVTTTGPFQFDTDFCELRNNSSARTEFVLSPSIGATLTSTGMLNAGIDYEIGDNFTMTNRNGPSPGAGTATGTLTLTLTAVPEPTSVGLLALAITGLLGRRRLH